LKRLWQNKATLGYIGVLAVCLAIGMLAGYTPLAARIDDLAYDWTVKLNQLPAPTGQAIVLAIDDATYQNMGGIAHDRRMLAQALELLAKAPPKVVVIDLLLADEEGDSAEDQRLEKAMRATKSLVLVADQGEQGWQEPLSRFPRAAVGHDRSDINSNDGVTRTIPLEARAEKKHYWTLAIEALRLARGRPIVESPTDLQIGDELIPAPLTETSDRALRVDWGELAQPISLWDLVQKPERVSQLAGKVVFIGVTSMSAVRDRVKTPIGEKSGVEVHAQLFETLARGKFLTDARDGTVLGFCALACVLAGALFAWRSGWTAYLLAAALLVGVHVWPFALFRSGIVFPYFAPVAVAWLSVSGAASYQHFVVRRQLRRSETERSRYQQAIHWVTHEMRTPLTAIQGSSELMGRYNLPEEKRNQIAQMINSESKRLARMIQTFLDVERLSDGQMELKKERFAAGDIVQACLERVRPLADRKDMRIGIDGELAGEVIGDRELMEYAVYNLMTNAVKYSPASTEISVACRQEGDQLRLSIRDQGIGMDERELRKIFQKFYRTKRAEASGETGTGIGLSIVEQIVRRHGGKMEVTSAVGKGSCFTVVLPAYSRASRGPSVSV